MERGWIKLYRKTLDSGILQNINAWQLFGYLLLKATHKPIKVDARGELLSLQPGELVFGRKKAAIELDTTEKKIRTALAYLEKNEIVAIRATKRYSVISIMNWDTYQSDLEGDGHDEGHERAMRGPCEGHERATKQECKNIRTKEREENLLVATGVATPRKPPRNMPDPKYAEFAKRFQVYIRDQLGSVAPKITDALIQNSAIELDRAVRIDGLDWGAIQKALRWGVSDSFWSRNLLSLAVCRRIMQGRGISKIKALICDYENSHKTTYPLTTPLSCN